MTQHPIRIASVLLSLAMLAGPLVGCDKGDEEAKKKKEQEYVEKIIAKVTEVCACPDPACAKAANRAIDTIRNEAKEDLGSFPSSEAHKELMPHMTQLGQCLVGKI